ncbi:hypothetical protein MYCTH_102943 [Thermothelomyces thermophilus ATCC 42464]|uniref:Alpha/beta hydrolase fold-3 domain-containing protein n=1 Tax=Thermothelomyces thermophilus (strain ATCC 42464 / BCRC 31852 / DSM 1799) TaxID=573729 RepID=G2QGD6_THET4|nr:uncharacterized protein MYCTH_102943 [Thermothelomyces thermophilus ATCC 42464]AEO58550.1 hypothetical protein MYCTH_102943 [Thermothelomyces thermophilus ATCC 42464]
MSTVSTQDGAGANGEHEAVIRKEVPSFLTRLSYAGYMYGLKSILAAFFWLREWKESRNPPEGGPDIVKTYECRPHLPVRIFFPSSYDQTSPVALPTLFTIHGGGFCVGHQRDDDEWNRAFADSYSVLVISLNYSKAPTYPFPAAPHDVEALLLAALEDASLPIDRGARAPASRTAILGFSAGGNLALSVSQLPAVRAHPLAPRAAITVYGSLDLSCPPHEKLQNRPYKPALRAPRGNWTWTGTGTDPVLALAPASDWSYIPYGQDLRDPLLSPLYYRDRAALPAFVGVVAAELDMLAHESWRFACRLSRGRAVPDRRSADARRRVCGDPHGRVTSRPGELIGLLPGREDERFAFEETVYASPPPPPPPSYYSSAGSGGGGGGGVAAVGGVKWLLVPDVLHGFDNPHMRALMGGTETIKDAELKTEAYRAELARWLKEVVWRV